MVGKKSKPVLWKKERKLPGKQLPGDVKIATLSFAKTWMYNKRAEV